MLCSIVSCDSCCRMPADTKAKTLQVVKSLRQCLGAQSGETIMS